MKNICLLEQRVKYIYMIFGIIVIAINTGKKSKCMTNYCTLNKIRFIKKKCYIYLILTNRV